MSNNNSKYTTILIGRENYNKLKQLGTVPESFNVVIGRLIDEHYQHLRGAAGAAAKRS